jgi:hypothetical protein
MSWKLSTGSLSTRRSAGRKQAIYTKEIKQNSKQRNINNMMQWLDRFCRYKTFGAKILKQSYG